MKLCECGCGLPAPVSKRTDRKRGYEKDKPMRFIAGHNISSPTKKVKMKCEQCGEEKELYPSDAKRFRFCSRKCQGLNLRYTNNISPEGSSYIDHWGYRHVKYSDGWEREHRRVMEQYLGRKLLSEEHIHHVDGDKLNNELENLQLTNKAEHGKIHATDLVERARKNEWWKNRKRDAKGRFL